MPVRPDGAVHPAVIDADALIGLCKSGYAKVVFERFAMSTTNVCNEEVKRGRDDPEKPDVHRRACERYVELLRENRNPHVQPVEPWKPHVSDQGEATLRTILENHGGAVRYVIVFDEAAIEAFEQLRVETGNLQFKIRYPNFPLEYLRRCGILTDDEYCDGTYRMAQKERWTTAKLLSKLTSMSDVDCPQL